MSASSDASSSAGPKSRTRPVPVTLVITDLDVGGAERAMVALAVGLKRDRWNPMVVALGPESTLARPIRDAGIETICLDVHRRRPLRAVARLAGVLKSSRAELVQAFLFHANIASRLAAKAAGVEVVLGGLRVAEKGASWHLAIDRATAWLSSGSVCVSEGVRRHAIARNVQSPDRLFVIPNGIGTTKIDGESTIARSVLGIAENCHLALFVGRIDHQKGVTDLLKSARIVASQKPDWRLLLVGDGPLRTELEMTSDSDPILERSLIWLGRRNDVVGLMKAADVLVLPSLWEGMPNVVLEAMAASLPVVATSVEGSEDLVIPGETGWLVPPGDSLALASALIEVTTDPDRLRRFGEAGRVRVEENFSQEAVVAAYDRLWSKLLGMP